MIFFYDADIAHAVAFSGLLNDGHELARRLTVAGVDRNGPQLLHIATDGESYGHHHRFGEMALAAAIESIDRDALAQLTNYAAYLDRVAVHDDVEVRDNTSWSCAHGVERWRANCGCNSGGHPGWQQTWRAPLRAALDWLKTQLDDLFERQGETRLRDPWAARDAYAAVLLDRRGEQRQAFLERHAFEHPIGPDRVRIWKLLEMQRYALLSFTSCGWFFDEPSGIETVQVLTYAARTLQLASELGTSFEPEFLRVLQPLRSNLPAFGDGRQLYRQLVRPLVTDGARLMAHYAITSLFDPPAAEARVYAARVVASDRAVEDAGVARVALGRARLLFEPTEESAEYIYAALHLGGHDIQCAVSPTATSTDFALLQTALRATFLAEPLTELVRRIDRDFGGAAYTLHDVFVAERRRILDHVTAQAMRECTAEYERMMGNNRRLLDFLAQVHVPLPQELRVAATFVLQRWLEQRIAGFVAQTEAADAALAVWADAQRWGITPSTDAAGHLLERALEQAVAGIGQHRAEAAVARAHAVLDLAHALGLTLNTWEAQNQYYVLIATNGRHRWTAALLGEIRRLGERLSFRLQEWKALAARAA